MARKSAKMRGFIGPLGDDIPSIFPIIAGVMLFIGTIIYANNEAAARSGNLHLRQAGLELSYIALQKGYISAPAFLDTCERLVIPTARKNNVNFALFLRDCTTLDQAGPFEGTEICKNVDDAEIAELGQNRTPYSLFNYPVSTDCNTVSGQRVGLGNINIVTWYN